MLTIIDAVRCIQLIDRIELIIDNKTEIFEFPVSAHKAQQLEIVMHLKSVVSNAICTI